MSQENIWEESLNEKVEKVKTISIIRRSEPHEFTKWDLRNYFNTHSVNEIDVNSMYDYFKDNMFKDCNGLYLSHSIIDMPYVPYDKIYKALDEVFNVISPNMGSRNEDNVNYFQYYMIAWRKKGVHHSHFKELYELGLEHGLDITYLDSLNHTNADYYIASAPLVDILNNYTVLFNGYNDYCIRDALEILKERFRSLSLETSEKSIFKKIIVNNDKDLSLFSSDQKIYDRIEENSKKLAKNNNNN